MSDPRIRVLCAIGEMSGGGSERQMLGILKRLDRERFAPHLYLISPGGELLPEVPDDVPVSIFWQRYERPRFNWPGRIHQAQVADLARVIREHAIDVIYDRTYHMTMITARAAERTRVPRASVIVSNPRVDFETNRERFRWLKLPMLRRAYRTADQVVAVSEGTARLAAEFFHLPPERIQTIYNFVDAERLQAASEVPSDWERERFHIVAAGRLHEAKGYPLLLRAVRDAVHKNGLRQILLHILGVGPQEGELKRLMDEYGLASHVRLEGFQPNPFSYLRASNLFVLSSIYEGLPNVLIEAMMVGTPVVSTDCPSGPREILRDGKFGQLTPPKDAGALTGAIVDAVENEASWRLRATQAREYAERTFGPEAGIERVEKLLLELTKLGPVRE
ncbi:MAG: glycosyltransferase [Planctomycetales bacterium]|nr:glycosyltransferase [Planctomycetales bacterium]